MDRQTSNIDDLDQAFAEITRHQDIINSTLQSILTMIDNQHIFSMWVKDQDDRYIYASLALRKLLFSNINLVDIIGKTDIELAGPQKDTPRNQTDTSQTQADNQLKDKPVKKEKCDPVIMDALCRITPDRLPNIDKFGKNKTTRICTYTDVITRAFKKPCKFVETVKTKNCTKTLIVWKRPIIEDGIVKGTVGTLIDMTHQKDRLMKIVLTAVDLGKAYRIDSTENYYFTNYDYGNALYPDRFFI